MSLRSNRLIASCVAATVIAVSGCASDPSMQASSVCGGDAYLNTHANAFQENRFVAQSRADHMLPALSDNQNMYIAERQRSNTSHASQHVETCRQNLRRVRAESRRDFSEGLQNAVAQR